MNDAGTLQEVRAFLALCDEVRQPGRAERDLRADPPREQGRQGVGGGGSRRHAAARPGEGTGPHPPARPEGPLGVGLARPDLELAGPTARASRSKPSPSCPTRTSPTLSSTPSTRTPARAGRRSPRRSPGRARPQGAIRDRMLADGRIVNVVKENGTRSLWTSAGASSSLAVPGRRPHHQDICAPGPATAPAQPVPPRRPPTRRSAPLCPVGIGAQGQGAP